MGALTTVPDFVQVIVDREGAALTSAELGVLRVGTGTAELSAVQPTTPNATTRHNNAPTGAQRLRGGWCASRMG